jgi:hypothetical protein
MRKLIAGAALALIVAGGGGTAFAGEINGSGHGGPNKETPGVTGAYYHSNSECSFSGLEDGSENPAGPSGPGTTQNWGQIPKAERDGFGGFNPGQGCNGHTAGRK